MELGLQAMTATAQRIRTYNGLRRHSKIVIAALVSLGLAGCSSDSVRLGTLLWHSVNGEGGKKISIDQAAAIPFATMGLELGSNDEALLVLGTSIPGREEWYAGENVMVRTRAGRVVRTAGLPYDLGGMDIQTPDAAPGIAGAATIVLSLDFPDMGLYGARATCKKHDEGSESVNILGSAIATRHVVERCKVPTLDWNFDNEFWTDPDNGFVWRSVQYIHPESPPLILEVLRPKENGPS
jgi:hypothetical protein